MKKLLLILALGSCFAFADDFNQSLNTKLGGERLAKSIYEGYATSFLNEVQYLTYQHNLFNCGPTSIAITLNALHVPAPLAESLGNYQMYTYKNTFTPEVVAKTGISENTIFKQPGLTLDQAGEILNAFNGVNATVYHANQVDIRTAKKTILTALKQPNTIVLANILRSEMGQTGGGHFSPLGAYEEKSDSILFVDVASFKTWGPSWIPFKTLYNSMHTLDGNKSRGFIVVTYTPPVKH